MGVLKCDRDECGNVMCDRRSATYGNICGECFEELVSLGAFANIRDFMRSRKGASYKRDPELARARFESEFPKGG